MRFILTAAVAAVLATSAQAGVLFSDNFDAEPADLTVTTLANWTVSGNVDVVDTGTYGITCDVRCIDLDGTTGPGQIVTSPIAFSAGSTVRIQFDLSGSQRSGAGDDYSFIASFSDLTDIAAWSRNLPILGAGVFGPVSNVVNFFDVGTISGSAGWNSYFLEFLPLESGSISLLFATSSGDNVGPLVDNVLVTQNAGVPEPATWAMLITGFGLVGFAARRRRTLAIA